MSAAPRLARVRALAKINLDLRVLARRPDGYHELRTVFQTVSLADTIEIAYSPARRTAIELDDPLGLPDNLVLRAAQAAMEAMGATGRVRMRLDKRIPMGAGLGGGSSDAAAVLLALPALAGRSLDMASLCRLAGDLGSDVPFFLAGGAAVGIGRGTELFPLPDGPPAQAVLVAPRVSVSTADAYRRLSPRLTTELQQNKIFSFQSNILAGRVGGETANDFEEVVFERHPVLGTWKKRMIRAGATAAMMTGSGSAVFGLFRNAGEAAGALAELGKYAEDEKIYRISLVGRARYRALWWRALEEHITGKTWPPRSRHSR
jgi:4-diphosphocytidyl-2-C-methyl-D-erythritol kinase